MGVLTPSNASLVISAMPSAPAVIMSWSPSPGCSSATCFAADILWCASKDTVHALELTKDQMKQYRGYYWPGNVMVSHVIRTSESRSISLQFLPPDLLYVCTRDYYQN